MRSSLAISGAAVLMMTGIGPGHAAGAGAALAEECQGQPATIVATGQATGTDGDDVIVLTGTQSSSGVSAKGGDDLICVRGVLPKDEFGGGPGVWGGPGDDSLQVRLAGDNDYLEVSDVEDLDVRMGGGFDQLRLYRTFGSGTVGAGKDGGVLKLEDFDKRVLVDLEDRRMALDGRGSYAVTGFQRVIARAPRVTLKGDHRPNMLYALACRGRVSGGRGGDTLWSRSWDEDKCGTRGVTLLGQKGDDRMSGTSNDDELLGGPGRDRAHGKQGVDTCAAETETSCER